MHEEKNASSSRTNRKWLRIGPQYPVYWLQALIYTVASRTRDVNRYSVVHGARIYVRITMKQVRHLRQTVQPARGSETELALLERFLENARPGEKERKIDEEQEAGVFHDVACAVYANWARVNARDAQDGI